MQPSKNRRLERLELRGNIVATLPHGALEERAMLALRAVDIKQHHETNN
jgi:hypothetical protein